MPIDLARLMDNDDVRDAFGTICDLYPEDDPRTPVWCSFDTPGDGHPAETLFGSFTIDDSPELSCPMQ
jgi:hypothetical protein